MNITPGTEWIESMMITPNSNWGQLFPIEDSAGIHEGWQGGEQSRMEGKPLDRKGCGSCCSSDMAKLRSLFWLKHEGVTTEIFHFIIVSDLISYTLGARLLVVEITNPVVVSST